MVAQPCDPAEMISLVTVLVAAAFGAADQYLGSIQGHFGGFAWTTDVSLLSAPWLLLAFVAGCTQRDPRRAAFLGLGATFAALVGYMAMTLSPMENAHLSAVGVAGFVRSDPYIFVGGVATGPLFGWFGQRWRVHRAWRGAVVAGAMLCLEPLAHVVAGRAITSVTVAWTEVGIGLAGVAYVVVMTVRRRWIASV
jgi:hypothetical protein